MKPSPSLNPHINNFIIIWNYYNLGSLRMISLSFHASIENVLAPLWKKLKNIILHSQPSTSSRCVVFQYNSPSTSHSRIKWGYQNSLSKTKRRTMWLEGVRELILNNYIASFVFMMTELLILNNTWLSILNAQRANPWNLNDAFNDNKRLMSHPSFALIYGLWMGNNLTPSTQTSVVMIALKDDISIKAEKSSQ